MFLESAESLISEYLSSEHLLFLQGPEKEGAESVLTYFFHQAKDLGIPHILDLRAKNVEAVFLESMPRANLSLAVKKAAPKILVGFFDFLSQTGRVPPAGAWSMCVQSLEEKYLSSIRDDGSVKGSTFKKKYTDVGRNDPCPCGSGQKFKKCCMAIL